jgi:thioesterase domain-containing protein
MAVASAASALIRRANLALSMPYVAPNGELETLIAKLFAEVLTLDHVGADDDFSQLGGDSLLGEVLSMLISERTGFDFEIPLLVEHGSPRRISALLRSKGVVASSYRSRQAGKNLGSLVKIVSLQQGNDNTPLYCMPAISGTVSEYIELAKILGGDRPVYGIQIADQAQTEKLGAFASLREMAASIVAKLLTHHRDGPICLIGYSFGGSLAIEVAQQLVVHGQFVPFVGLIDTVPGPGCLPLAYRIYHFARNIGPWGLNFAPWALKVATREITEVRHWVNFCKIILRKLRGQPEMQSHDWYKALPESRRHLVERNNILSRRYRFEGIYRGTIFLFRHPRAVLFDSLLRPIQLDDFDWRRITGANVRVVQISGDHTNCISHPHVVNLGNELSLALDVALQKENGRTILSV